MTLNPDKLGYETSSYELDYDWRTLALYALGIGAKAQELDYLYEGRGPKAYPSFGVVPAYPILIAMIEASGGDFSQVVHGSQLVRVLNRLPPSGTLQTVGAITGMYDLRRMAQLTFETRTSLDGTPIYETEWSIICRGDGGFGGPRRPKPVIYRVPDGATPSFSFSERTSPEQALLYRLSGDTNPLHADPEFAASVGFEQGPILHGLATFGFLCRAVVLNACDGDADRLRELSANFQNPVWPGEVLRSEAYASDDRLVLQVFADDRPAPVIGNAYAVVD